MADLDKVGLHPSEYEEDEYDYDFKERLAIAQMQYSHPEMGRGEVIDFLRCFEEMRHEGAYELNAEDPEDY